jgi:TonB family protein
VAFVSAALIVSTAKAADQPLQPLGKWTVSDGDTVCIASRSYGAPAAPLTLAVVPSPNGETYELLVSSKYTADERAIEEQGSIDFGNGPISAWALFYQTANKRSDVHDFRIPATEVARAESAPSMTLHISGSSDFAFELDSMPQVLGQLRGCTAELNRRWNVDGARNADFSRLARGNLRNVFGPEDYPLQALWAGKGGKGQYLLLIDERGKVDGCQVLQPTGVPVLDVTACAVIEGKAKFTPALDKDGKPVRDTIITPPIEWEVR